MFFLKQYSKQYFSSNILFLKYIGSKFIWVSSKILVLILKCLGYIGAVVPFYQISIIGAKINGVKIKVR